MDDSALLGFMTKPQSLEEVLANDEYTAIRDAATKLQERLNAKEGSDGILTASRALVESTCKTLLDCLNIEYKENADMPDLGKELAIALDLHPGSKTNRALKQVCQGAISMLNGIGSVRNLHGDAHGRGLNAEAFPFRHAELTAYIACSLTAYFVESFEAKVSRKDFADLDQQSRDTLVSIWMEVGKKHKMTNPDRLPYTEALEEIAQRFTGDTGIVLARREIYWGLQNLRKAKALPKLELDN